MNTQNNLNLPPTPMEARKLFDDVMRAGSATVKEATQKFIEGTPETEPGVKEAYKMSNSWERGRKKKKEQFEAAAKKAEEEAKASEEVQTPS